MTPETLQRGTDVQPQSGMPDWLSEHKGQYPFECKRHRLSSGHVMSFVDLAPQQPEGDERRSALSNTPTVMIHGNPTWSFYYRNLLRAVSEAGGRAIAPDHIGCGLSDKPAEEDYDYTLAQRVSDLDELLESIGLGSCPINLVVHDWGGMIGMAYASRHPERINRLTILNTAAFHIPEDKRLPFTLWLGRNTTVGQLLIQGLNAFSGLATRWACMKPLSNEVAKAYTAPYHSWSTRIATHRFVKDIPLAEGDPAFSIVTETEERLALFSETPILIGWGLKDFVFDHTFLRVWQTLFPNAECHIYPESGHYILEDESDELIPKSSDSSPKQVSSSKGEI